METKIKDSGTRSEFATGAVRDGEAHKGRYDLLPAHGVQRVARVFELGGKKYGDRNWEKGIPLHRYLDSALRHALKLAGGHHDEDHGAQAAWNLLAYLETEHRIANGVLPVALNTLPFAPHPAAFEGVADTLRAGTYTP